MVGIVRLQAYCGACSYTIAPPGIKVYEMYTGERLRDFMAFGSLIGCMASQLPTSEGVWFATSDERAYLKIREGAEFCDSSKSEFLRDAGVLLAEIDELLHEQERYFPNRQEKHAYIKQAILEYDG